ncbi:hypothetical protein ACKFKG_07940 [Phormidesmis sp. 146-35]
MLGIVLAAGALVAGFADEFEGVEQAVRTPNTKGSEAIATILIDA